MRLCVLIPAYNEERTLGEVIKSIPKKLPEIIDIKIVVVNDGSTDNTEKVALEAGADFVVNHNVNQGLAWTMNTGITKCLEIGADVIVTTDADGQYDSSEISLLVKPIVKNQADLVLGDRQINKLDHMQRKKKYGNKIVSRIVSSLCKQKINDAQTGFRALNRECALRISIMSDYTYTQEMILQAKHCKLKILDIPITFRKRYDNSRLITNILSYAVKTACTMIRTLTFYVPTKTYGYLSSFIILVGALILIRPLENYLATGNISPYIPSLLISSILLVVGVQAAVTAIMAGMNKNNNKMLSEILYLTKKQSYPDEIGVKKTSKELWKGFLQKNS